MILIEVASQHPLLNGITPGREFSLRLDKGIELYKKLVKQKNQVKIYVPGSRHRIMVDGHYVDDKISLSEAGYNYLVAHGFPKNDIYALEKSKQYAPDGIYSTIEECETTSKIFKNEKFERLYSIAASEQIGRMQGAYEYFGILGDVEFIGIDEHEVFHNKAESEEKRLRFLSDPEKTMHEIYVNARKERVPADGRIW